MDPLWMSKEDIKIVSLFYLNGKRYFSVQFNHDYYGMIPYMNIIFGFNNTNYKEHLLDHLPSFIYS
jgi:TRAP-type mannitol/chloroaromatic compound transport system permease large subunit